MSLIDKRILTHFDFIIIILLLPLIIVSGILINEIHPDLSKKHLIYVGISLACFFLFFFFPIRRFLWLIPMTYWGCILLLLCVEFFGVSKLGAQRWVEIPFTSFTIQPSEIIKPAFLLMLGFVLQNKPPPEEGYGWKYFFKISFYIFLPCGLIVKEPDLGTALVLLIVGYGVLFLMGVKKSIWTTIFIFLAITSPIVYEFGLTDYQKRRILDFIGEEPGFQVRQSIIAIGSGGVTGKPKEKATQTQLKFLPIASSDFIFAYVVERFGFLGAVILVLIYAILILHLFSLNFITNKDYYIKVLAVGLSLMLFVYMGVNIFMTLGMAPVVGLPLPMFSYGGSNFLNFTIIFAILENFLTFRFFYSIKDPIHFKF